MLSWPGIGHDQCGMFWTCWYVQLTELAPSFVPITAEMKWNLKALPRANSDVEQVTNYKLFTRTGEAVAYLKTLFRVDNNISNQLKMVFHRKIGKVVLTDHRVVPASSMQRVKEWARFSLMLFSKYRQNLNSLHHAFNYKINGCCIVPDNAVSKRYSGDVAKTDHSVLLIYTRSCSTNKHLQRDLLFAKGQPSSTQLNYTVK